MSSEKLLELRKKIKSKKPEFNRHDSHKRKRLKKNWRKPRGLQSKMRLSLRGYAKAVTKGYGSPSEVYGLDKSGLKIVRINSVQELEKLNPKQEGALISTNLGLKKRIIIVKKAKEKGITILNIKNADKWLKEVEEKFVRKKEEKKKKKETKQEKKKELEKKSKEEKEKLIEKLTEEEKKQKEKEEKDKVLIKKS